ncbi:MAG: SPOR domain-containing protein [Zoogloea sp.]|jgi:hypothetical protein|nr:SPOR domain-containing protein [Zoogloea sp.]
MAQLRVIVIALVFANLLALTVWKGWIGGGAYPGEPERLSNQLSPERMRLVAEVRPAAPAPVAVAPAAPVLVTPAASDTPPQGETSPQPAAPAPVPETSAPPGCVAFGGVSAAQLDEIKARSAGAGPGFKLTESRSGAVSSWWVHVPSLGSKEAAERKAAEIRKLGVDDLFIVQDPGPAQFAISLGLYKNEVQANRLLESLREKGVRSAQVAGRGASVLRVELRGPSDSLATLASDLSERLRGANRLECSP